MEEDIEKIKDFIKLLKAEPKENPKAFLELHYNFQKEIAQAIENLINRNKELEEENRTLREDYQTENQYYKEKIEEKIKEVNEEFDKRNTPDNNEWYIDSEICAYATQALQELLEE